MQSIFAGIQWVWGGMAAGATLIACSPPTAALLWLPRRPAAGDDLYGGTSRLLSRVVPAAGIDVTNVDTSDVA